jgi:hypothetical protein
MPEQHPLPRQAVEVSCWGHLGVSPTVGGQGAHGVIVGEDKEHIGPGGKEGCRQVAKEQKEYWNSHDAFHCGCHGELTSAGWKAAIFLTRIDY